jgi:hypothetical protein
MMMMVLLHLTQVGKQAPVGKVHLYYTTRYTVAVCESEAVGSEFYILCRGGLQQVLIGVHEGNDVEKAMWKARRERRKQEAGSRP